VAPARFGDEWATPDEWAVAGLEQLVHAAGLDPGEVRIAPEDTVPRLRRPNHGTTLTSLRRSAWAQSSSEVALDLRRHGCPTVTRRRELSASGVAWVATTTALGLGGDPDGAAERYGPLARHFVADSSTAQAAAVRELLADPDLRATVAEAQVAGMGLVDPDAARHQLADALTLAGALPPPVRDRDRLQRLVAARGAEEYREVPPGGTLAAADARIAALEEEMVPLRLLGREDAIDLQSTLDDDARYRVYARTHLDAGPAAAPVQTEASRAVRFSILVPTYDSDPDLLDACIRSVVDQQHENWVLCLLDDGSPRRDHLEVLQRWAGAEPRIELRCNDWNQGIALATNDALAMAAERARDDGLGEGDDHFVVLLDHDDVLRPDALAWVARYASACPEYELWYSDEDKILPDGELGSPFFKPDWSPELLMGVNYVCHLLSVRAEVLEEVRGFRAGFDGAQDYDLVLRLVDRIAERGGRVGHIAKPLYSWRVLPGSTALDTTEKPAAHLAGHLALEHALDRHDELATVEDGEYDTTHRIRYGVDTSQLLTVAIPTRDRVDLLARCVQRLRATAGALPYELLVIDNDSTDPDTLAYLDRLVAEGHQVVRYPHEFSFARQINLAALHARGDLLLVLNNDTWAHNDDWLLRMMEHAQRPEVGLVGAKLVFPPGMRGDRPQHEGIVIGMAGLAYNVDLGGYRGLDQFVRNTSGVTAACVMLRPSVFLEVGGMEERLRVAYNDVDFGLRVGEWGYRVIYTPHAVLEHPESASRGDLHPTEDEEWLIDRWGPKGAVREPFISPHLEWLMPVFFRL
jgi:GT2 family glycosyltransferase